MERVRTSELKMGGKTTRNFVEGNRLVKFFLKVVGVLGVSLVMSGQCQRAALGCSKLNRL